MESIKISELKEEVKFYTEYTVMISIVAIFSALMNLFPIGVKIINALILAVTIVSSLTLLYVIRPLIISLRKLRNAEEHQQDLQFNLNEEKIDRVLTDLNNQVENIVDKNDMSIIEILNDTNVEETDYDIEYDFNNDMKRILSINKYTSN